MKASLKPGTKYKHTFTVPVSKTVPALVRRPKSSSQCRKSSPRGSSLDSSSGRASRQSIRTCQRRLNSDPPGMRQKSWTELCRNSEALTVFERAEGAKGDLDPLFVVPADVAIECLNELFEGRGVPLPRIEQLGLQTAEEALKGRVVRRAAFARHRADQIRIADAREPARPAIVGTSIGVKTFCLLSAACIRR